MKLTHLRASSIYERLDLDEEIKPVTLVVGPNESGKSTLLGLVDLAVVGPRGANFPLLGTSPRYDWSVEATMDEMVVHRYMKRGSHKLEVDGRKGSTKLLQGEIHSHIGQSGVFSLSAFMSLSPDRRFTWLQDTVLPGGGWTAEQAQEELDKVIHAGELVELLGDQAEAWTSAKHEDGRGLLSCILKLLAEADRDADRDVKRLTKVIEHQEMDASPSDTSGSIPFWESERKRIDAEMGAQREYIGKMKGLDESRRVLAARKDALIAQLNDLRSQDWERMISASGDALTRKRVDVADATTRHRNAVDAVAGTEATLKEAVDSLSACKSDIADGNRRLESFNAEAEIYHSMSEVFDVLNEMTSALMAVERDEHAKLIAVARKHLEKRDSYTPESKDALWNELHDMGKQHETAESSAKAANEAHREAQQRAEGTAGELLRTERIANEYATAVEKLIESKEAAASKETSLHAEISELTVGLEDIPDTNTVAAENALEQLAASREDAQAKIDRINDELQASASYQAALVSAAEATERRSGIRDVVSCVKPRYQMMMSELAEGLAEDVSRITRSVLDADWVPDLVGGFTFDLHRGDVNLGPGSRSVQAVTAMAMRLAFIRELGGSRSLVLDDLENLEDSRRDRFLSAMVEEVSAGRLDNFLGACVLPAGAGWTPPDGVHVIRMGE